MRVDTMKKILLICILGLILSGCIQNAIAEPLLIDDHEISRDIHLPLYDSLSEEVEEIKFSHSVNSFLGDTSQEFIEYLYQNPIDIAIRQEWEELFFTTVNANALNTKHYNMWVNEMNIAYEELSAILSDEMRVLLESSQDAWEIVHQQNSALSRKVVNSVTGGGSGDSMLVADQIIDSVRMRTFLLAEYYYWLTGDFNFSHN